MSASNWSVCPRCVESATAAFAAEDERVAALYGTGPVDEFDAARKALSERDFDPGQTFREDYEFYGADLGEVCADYSGVCTECNLSLHFKASRRFYPEAAA